MDNSVILNIRALAQQRLIQRLEEATKESNKLHSTVLASGAINNSRSLFQFVDHWRSVVDDYRLDLQAIWSDRVNRLIPRLDEAQRSACVEATLASFDDGCKNIQARLEHVLQLISKRFIGSVSNINAWQQLQPNFESRRQGLRADLELRLAEHELPSDDGNTTGATASGHRLAAVLFGDIVGSSARMGADESAMLADRAALLQIVEASTKRHGGRLVNTMGDGFMLEFPSAVDGMAAGMDIQASARVPLRIGLNVCDVVIAGDDILGDGVNIAKRLEERASVGHICLPDFVAGDLVNKFKFLPKDLGEVTFKNIGRAIRIVEVDPQAPRLVATSLG